MRVKPSHWLRQALQTTCRAVLALAALLVIFSCTGKNDEEQVIPPETSPLSLPFVGFGVVNVSYTHLRALPTDASDSTGYLRRASVVRILERQIKKQGDMAETWALVDGDDHGWLREELLDVYENEAQALTSSKSMTR